MKLKSYNKLVKLTTCNKPVVLLAQYGILIHTFISYIEKIFTCRNGDMGQNTTMRFARDTGYRKDDIVVWFSKYPCLFFISF